MGVILSVEKMTCGYNGKPVLNDVSLEVDSGDILCILGPNGVGKTTLFKSMLGLIPPISGSAKLHGKDISEYSYKERARHIGYVPQSHTPPFPYTVREVVLMGRVSNIGVFSSPSERDVALTDEVLGSLGLNDIAERDYTELSGGERQMVLIARALVQQPEILLMDEPTANLDYGNQAKVLSQITQIAAGGMAVVMTTHSPDHAYSCSSKVALIERGSRYTFGTAEEVVTRENLERTYGVEVCIISEERTGRTIRACAPVI